MDTIGSLIDKLTVVNIRIWMAEDVIRNDNTSDKDIIAANKVSNIANSLRNDLIQEIDEKLNHMVQTGELQKLYKQGTTKMYGKK